MVHWCVWDNDHELTIQINPMVKCLFTFMFGLESNGCFVTGVPCLNWSHGYKHY
jgi:hypothetical protein